ncbi:glycosyltransferase [Streptomyces piniterrae]|uniref:D-inositol 3-phosphate glycosyltransferase n=1 Tax=Streptomyces piniterrae TaxID=2571125 RepID=A0A4U0NNG3_9ACTN|nr:glycosyltransferase [Streptomyces piniterrae]TJZ55947.1 glycosyltransferase [Streptomyces piniterrae]
MKVLHIITGLEFGGAEQQLRLLLRRLPANCEVVTLTNPGPVADGIRADGTPVTHLGMSGNRDLGAIPRLARLIRGGRYDLVHTHLYRAGVYGRIAARLAGVRAVVGTEHSLGETRIEGRRLTRGVRRLYRATERLGSATVAVSDTVADRLVRWGVPEERIHVVPNGIEGHRFAYDPDARTAVREMLGVPADAFVVGGVGRLVPGKRFDVLVRAVTHLSSVHLLLAGDGPERAALQRMARQFAASDRIHLLGARGGVVGPATGDVPDEEPGIPGLLSAMDVFVSPSSEEAFGLAVLEALASGLHVLYGDCPAIDELPSERAPGARRCGADPYELSQAIRKLRSDGPGRLPVPPVVEHYDIGLAAESLMAVYEQALAGTSRARGRVFPARVPAPDESASNVSLPDPSRSPAADDPSLSKR